MGRQAALGQTHLTSGVCLFSWRRAVFRFVTAGSVPIFMACLWGQSRVGQAGSVLTHPFHPVGPASKPPALGVAFYFQVLVGPQVYPWPVARQVLGATPFLVPAETGESTAGSLPHRQGTPELRAGSC